MYLNFHTKNKMEASPLCIENYSNENGCTIALLPTDDPLKDSEDMPQASHNLQG